MIKGALFLLGAAALLAATNPKEGEHARTMVAEAQRGCQTNPLGKLLCGGMAALAAAGMEYRDHLLFSTARLGETETVGVLGQVFVVSGTPTGD